jgi:DNA polymerase-3 subunit beta
MEIIIKKQVLLKSLQLLEPIVTSRTTLPISSDVLIQAEEKNKCVFIGTDIDTSLKCESECKVIKPGTVCLPAKKLLEAVKELPDEELTFRAKDEKSLLVELLCGKVKNTFIGQPSKNHPGMPVVDEKQVKNNQITIDVKVFTDALTKTVFATSKEETRYYLNGVYFNIQKEVAKFVATDGRRLAYVTRKIDNNKVSVNGIVPTKSVNRIIEIIEKLTPKMLKFSVLPEHFVLVTEEIFFVSRLVQGEFPAYEQVIPKNVPSIEISASQLKKGIKQVSWVTPEKGWGIKFTFNKGGVKLSAIVEAVGLSEVEIEIDYSGKELEVKFEPDYIMDMISVLDEKSTLLIGINDPTSPWIFQDKEDKDYLYILMPMKL